MEDNVGLIGILNQELRAFEALKDIDLKSKKVIYEVIRIIDRVPIFVEDHYQRLRDSMGSIGHPLDISEDDFKRRIGTLVKAHQQENCNIKVVMYVENGIQNFLSYISKSYYPSYEEYQKGVKVGLMQIERQNPNIKMINFSYKEESSKRIRETGVFEVLLVSQEGIVTEGSKSNAFFIKGDEVYTSPGEFILKGITRKYVLEACKQAGFNVVESRTTEKQLEEMDGVFISGTSIHILPVCSIEGRLINSSTNPVITRLMDKFRVIVDMYVKTHKE